MKHETMGHPRNRKLFALRILAVPAFLFLGTWIFQMLWNYAAPGAFNGGILGYWQAMALLVAARILVAMPGRRFHSRPGFPGERAGGPPRSREEWKARMKENYGGKDGHPFGPDGPGHPGRPGMHPGMRGGRFEHPEMDSEKSGNDTAD